MGNKFQKNIWHNKDWMIEQYINQKKSMRTIGLENNVGETCLHKWLHRLNIPIRSRSESMRGIEKTDEHRAKLSQLAKRNIGKLNHNWKHGKSKLHRRLRFKNYFRTREMVFKRDNYECQQCGLDMKLNMHHIKPVKDFPELVDDLNNLITLCKSCHRKLHFPIENFANSVKPQPYRVGNAELSGVNPDRFFEGSTSKCVETIYETVSNN